jgi:hypothetical protein
MKHHKTQDAIRLMRRRWLTTLDAINAVGLTSLSQRISNLRRAGWEFDQRVVVTATGSRVAAYKLRKEPANA